MSVLYRALPLFAAVLGLACASVSYASDKSITIGTAGVTGVYFPAGGAICRLVNTERKDHGIKCSVESTEGSIYNLDGIRHGDLHMGVTQSDWQYHALHGTGSFTGQKPFSKLRSVFSLHSEPFTVLARADAGVTTLADIKGKRVNIGNPGSGQRATMEVVMQAMGWKPEDFAQISELKAAEQGQALCDNKVDVIVYAAGHPNGALQEVTSACDTRLVSVDTPEIRKLIEGKSFYSKAVIPGKMYQGSENDTVTFGVKATLVSSEDVAPDLVYHVVKAVFDRFDDFKTLHPVFSTLEPDHMVLEGNTAPLHEGALRYFKESGLYDRAVRLQEQQQAEQEAAAEEADKDKTDKAASKALKRKH